MAEKKDELLYERKERKVKKGRGREKRENILNAEKD